MEYKDYYKIMGVKSDATQNEIKRAYRKLARKFHPDISKVEDAEDRFKEVGEAYEVLKDTEKRAAYDQLGTNWKAGQEFHPPPDWDNGFEFSGGGYTAGGTNAHSDFFEELFGRGYSNNGGRRSFHMRGDDHHAKVVIDIEDSFTSPKRAISLHMPKLTQDGHVVMQEHTLNVRIPKGIRAGQQIRLAAQGSPGMGGAESGDLYLEVEFRDHPLYKVNGADIFSELPVTPWEAALGASIQLPTPAGTVDIKIPPNSNQGRKLRLKGRGLPGKEPGDLIVLLQVTLPPADTDEAKKLYQQMEEQLAFNPRKKMKVV